MQPVVTCEYLLAPAFCDPKKVDDVVLDLMQVHSDVTSARNPPLIEDDAYEKLLLSGRFPTDKVFSKNIVENNETTYSANDISSIVNKILSSAKSLEDNDFFWVSDWSGLILNPLITEPHVPGRDKQLADFFSVLAIFNITQKISACALHHQANHVDSTKVAGTLNNAHPTSLSFPQAVDQEISIYSQYKNYLSYVDSSYFLVAPLGSHDLKLAIFAGALKALREAGQNLSKIEWSDFSIGEHFISSLAKNQSDIGQKYFSTVIACIVSIVAKKPKYPPSPFVVKAGSTEQITRGGSKAFRSHITKSGLALRLMHWEARDGHLVFANIGVKGELEIL